MNGFKDYFGMDLKRVVQPLEQIEYLDAGNGKNVFKLLMVSLITQTSPNVSYMDGEFDFEALYRLNCGDVDPKLEATRAKINEAYPDAYNKLKGIVTSVKLEVPKVLVDQYNAEGRFGTHVFDDGKNKYFIQSLKKTKGKSNNYYVGGDILIPNEKYVGVKEDNTYIDEQRPFTMVRCGMFIEPENLNEICIEMNRYVRETGLPEDLTLTFVFTTNKVAVQRDLNGVITGYTMNVSDWIPFETSN